MFKNFQLRSGIYLMDHMVHVSGFFEVEPWRGVDIDGAEKGQGVAGLTGPQPQPPPAAGSHKRS